MEQIYLMGGNGGGKSFSHRKAKLCGRRALVSEKLRFFWPCFCLCSLNSATFISSLSILGRLLACPLASNKFSATTSIKHQAEASEPLAAFPQSSKALDHVSTVFVSPKRLNFSEKGFCLSGLGLCKT